MSPNQRPISRCFSGVIPPKLKQSKALGLESGLISCILNYIRRDFFKRGANKRNITLILKKILPKKISSTS